MKRPLFIFAVFMFNFMLFTLYVNASADSAMPPVLQREGEPLLLNGTGVRTKLFLKLYVAGLYLQEKNKGAIQIIESDTPMVIRLHIVSSMITEEKMSKATEEGFHKSTRGKIDPIRTRMNQFISVFRAGIEKGDIFDMHYEPGTGVKVYRNGQRKVTIEGLDFKKALFGIWLSEDPVQEDLKTDMLGD